MTQHWDTIIVGAGVGGLTAAAALVKAGRQVLVLDRNPHPGGTAFVYRRRGFAFPMGPLGFSHPGRVSSLLEEVGGGDPLLCIRGAKPRYLNRGTKRRTHKAEAVLLENRPKRRSVLTLDIPRASARPNSLRE